MNFLKKAGIPWYVLLGTGAFACAISTACFLAAETFILGFFLLNTGQILLGTSAYIIGRISSFITIEKESSKYKKKMNGQDT